MKKRILAALLTLVMVVGLLPTAALAAPETGGSGGADAAGSVVDTRYSDSESAYEIYPVPHSVEYGSGGRSFTMTADVNVVADEGVDEYTIAFLTEILTKFDHTITSSAAQDDTKTNIVLAIDSAMTESAGTNGEGHYDPYTLTADSTANTNGVITITGKDTDCVYYGLATLQMMFTSFNGEEFLDVTIEDYSNTVFRGFIEGFYGGFTYPQRESQIRSIRDVKGNMYVFASKTDPYHGGQWATLYPADELAEIKNLVDVGKASKVYYTWSVHIGKGGVLNGIDPSANDAVDKQPINETLYAERLEKLKAKFQQLYGIGVRSFQILNDDYNSGTYRTQVKLLNDVNAWLKEKGDCMPLIYCCAGYNNAWAGDGAETTALRDLDDDIYLYWTGSDVNSPIKQDNVDWPREKSGQPIVTWLNYPCSEHCGKRGVFLGDISYYVAEADGLTGQYGLLSNPMDWAEANKVAYFQLFSWAWNRDNYTDYLTDLWEDSFKYLQPEVAGAYLTIARNVSAAPGSSRGVNLPESEYIRKKLEAVQTAALEGTDLTSDTNAQALLDEFDNIQAAVTAFEANCTNTNLKGELALWLDSLEYVTTAAREAILAVQSVNAADQDISEAWNHFSAGAVALGQWDAMKSTKQSGSKRIQPFANNLLNYVKSAMAQAFNPDGGLGGQSFYAVLHGVARTNDSNSARIFDGNSATYASYDSGQQAAGDYYGVDLGGVKLVSAVDILQGQNENDHNYFHKATLEYSVDGRDWTTLVTKVNSHHIRVEGLNIAARYVRLRLLESGYGSKSDYWTRIREFTVTTGTAGLYTDVAETGDAQASGESGVYTLTVPSLTLAAGEYVGIRLPEIVGIRTLTTAGTLPAGVKLQYSVSDESWTDNAPNQTVQMGYVRLYNSGSAAAALTGVTLTAAGPVRTVLSFVSSNMGVHAGAWSNVVDGDRSTLVHTNSRQTYGQYAIFDLGGKQPIHDITVWIPESGDDIPHNLDIFVSDSPEPEGTWTLLAEMRDNHYDMDVPNRYFACDGNGTMGRYLKLAVADVAARNWIKINELEVNTTVDQEDGLTAVSASSGEAQRAADGDLLTFFTPEAGAGYWEKLLQAPTTLSSVTVLRGAEGAAATVQVQKNGGWTGVENGTLTNTATTIDLTGEGDVTGVRVTWAAGSEPSIAEVILAGESASGGAAPTLLPNLYEKPADPAAVTVANGTALADVGLPAQVAGTLSNGTTAQVPVVWTCPDYDAAAAGDYTFTGTFQTTEVANPGCFSLTATVTVRPASTGEVENLALNGTAYASGREDSARGPEKAVDGTSTADSRWVGNYMKNLATNPSWIVVDLGENVRSISSIEMDYHLKVWHASYKIQVAGAGFTPTDYCVFNGAGDGSMDADTFTGDNAENAACWTTIKTVTGASYPDNSTVTIDSLDRSLPAGSRYLRIYYTAMNSSAGGHAISLKELRVMGIRSDEPIEEEETVNLALHRPVTASSAVPADTYGQGPKENATDGDTSTQWSSADMKTGGASADPNADQTPQWLTVDLGANLTYPVELHSVKLWYNVKVWPMVYKIQTSATGEENGEWTDLVSVTRDPAGDGNTSGWVQNTGNQTIADNAANTDTITKSSVPALAQNATVQRYVRFYVQKVNTKAGGDNVSLREIEIFGVNVSRQEPVDVAALLASATTSTVTAGGSAVSLPDAPQGGTLTVAGSTLENVVRNDGTIGGKNIGAREVQLLIRAWDNDAPDNYQQKNLTVTVPDHKSAYPAAWFPAVSGANPKPEVIPAIQEWYGYTGSFTLTADSRIVINDAANVGLQKAAENMKADLKEISGLNLPIVTGTSGGATDIYIESQTADSYDLGKEGYVLRVSDEGVKIYAPTYTGCLFGTITVEQILWQAADHLSVPKGIMRDYPAYEIRGMKIDIGRAPFRYQLLQDYAKIMLWYKMSEYDLHINDTENPTTSSGNATDDTHKGFHRLESTTFPSLAKMDGVKTAGVNPDLVDADYYKAKDGFGGNPWYTQQQWKDLTRLAEGYGMHLLTEIDLPGHALAYNQYVEEYPTEAAAAGIDGSIRYTGTETSNDKKIELLDLTGANAQRAKTFATKLWDEYTRGDDPVISGDVVHIGADEYWIHNTATNNAFAQFADALRGVIQGNLGPDTKIRMWGANKTSFSTATTILNMSHKELAEHYQLEIWESNSYEDPVQRSRDGYEIVNCEQSAMYSCPGRYGRDVPNAEYLFNSWDPTMFGNNGAKQLLYGDPNLLGAKAVMWGEQTQEGLTERDVHQRLIRAIPILAEKTWTGAKQSEGTFADYEMRAARLAEGPGTSIAMNVESETSLVLDYDFKNTVDGTVYDASGNGYNGALTGGTVDAEGWLTFNGTTELTTALTTLSYPYTVTFDLKVEAGNDDESSLFSGYDGRIQVAGHHGRMSANNSSFIRDLGYTVPTDGTAVNITIVGTQQAVRLYVNGERKAFLSQTEDRDGTGPYPNDAKCITSYFSSVPLPLEKIGQGFHGAMANLKVYNKALTADELTADDGLVNVAQDAIAGGSSFRTGDAYDNGVQRTAVAQKAVDGEAEEMYSYWRADRGGDTITVDLGKSHPISKIEAQWRNGTPSFTLQTSLDGKSWTNFTQNRVTNARFVKLTTGGAGNLTELLVYEAVDKTALNELLTRAEAVVAEKGLDITATGEDKALFDAVLSARAAKESPLAINEEVTQAVAALRAALPGEEEPTLSDNAALASLTLSAGTLTPAFAAGTTAYTAQVENTVTAVTVTPAAAHSGAQVAVSCNGQTLAQAPYTATLREGANTITVQVTAEDGTTKLTYTVTVTRAVAVVTPPDNPDDPTPPDQPTQPGGSLTPGQGISTTETRENEDGTTTKVVTAPDGTVTETTKKPGGVTEVLETKPDGTVTETVIDPTGAATKKETAPDEAVTITVTDKDGEEVAKVEIPAALPTAEKRFDDVPTTHWADEAIHKMAGMDVVKGTGGNNYSPVMSMDRASLATVLFRLSNGKSDVESVFEDVASGQWYAEAVAWAAKVEVVKGVSETEFAPEQIITREQLATMLCRYAKLLGLDTDAKIFSLGAFADGGATHDWAADGVAWCVERGILHGKGQSRLDPTANVSRAEVAVMLERFMELLKK